MAQRDRPDVPAAMLRRLRRVLAAFPECREEPAWVGTRWRVGSATVAHIFGGEDQLFRIVFRAEPDEVMALEHLGLPYFRAGWGAQHRRHDPRRQHRLGRARRAAHRLLLRAGPGPPGRASVEAGLTLMTPHQQHPATNTSAFGPVIPVLRIFDVAKAREFYKRVPRLRHRLGAHLRRPLAGLPPGQSGGGGAPPERAPRRRHPGSHRAHPRRRRDAPASGAARPRLSLRPARCRDPTVGAGGHGVRPLREQAGLPPTGGGEPTEGGGSAAGPIEHEFTCRVPAGARVRGLHRRIGSGGTRRTRRRA